MEKEDYLYSINDSRLVPYIGSRVAIDIQTRIKGMITNVIGKIEEGMDLKLDIDGKYPEIQYIYIDFSKKDDRRIRSYWGQKLGISSNEIFRNFDMLRGQITIAYDIETPIGSERTVRTHNNEIFLTVDRLKKVEGGTNNECFIETAVFNEKGEVILPWGDYFQLRRSFYKIGDNHYLFDFGRGDCFDTKKGRCTLDDVYPNEPTAGKFMGNF